MPTIDSNFDDSSADDTSGIESDSKPSNIVAASRDRVALATGGVFTPTTTMHPLTPGLRKSLSGNLRAHSIDAQVTRTRKNDALLQELGLSSYQSVKNFWILYCDNPSAFPIATSTLVRHGYFQPLTSLAYFNERGLSSSAKRAGFQDRESLTGLQADYLRTVHGIPHTTPLTSMELGPGSGYILSQLRNMPVSEKQNIHFFGMADQIQPSIPTAVVNMLKPEYAAIEQRRWRIITRAMLHDCTPEERKEMRSLTTVPSYLARTLRGQSLIEGSRPESTTHDYDAYAENSPQLQAFVQNFQELSEADQIHFLHERFGDDFFTRDLNQAALVYPDGIVLADFNKLIGNELTWERHLVQASHMVFGSKSDAFISKSNDFGRFFAAVAAHVPFYCSDSLRKAYSLVSRLREIEHACMELGDRVHCSIIVDRAGHAISFMSQVRDHSHAPIPDSEFQPLLSSGNTIMNITDALALESVQIQSSEAVLRRAIGAHYSTIHTPTIFHHIDTLGNVQWKEAVRRFHQLNQNIPPGETHVYHRRMNAVRILDEYLTYAPGLHSVPAISLTNITGNTLMDSDIRRILAEGDETS